MIYKIIGKLYGILFYPFLFIMDFYFLITTNIECIRGQHTICAFCDNINVYHNPNKKPKITIKRLKKYLFIRNRFRELEK